MKKAVITLLLILLILINIEITKNNLKNLKCNFNSIVKIYKSTKIKHKKSTNNISESKNIKIILQNNIIEKNNITN